MSGKSRRGKKRRHDDGLAAYRAYAKDPLYADYGKQVIALVKRGRQRDLPDEFLATCSPAAIITAMLELSDYQCASWEEGCTMFVPKLGRRVGPEGVEVALEVAGECPQERPFMCLKSLMSGFGYEALPPTELN